MNISKKGAMLLVGLGLISGTAGAVAMQIHAASDAAAADTQADTVAPQTLNAADDTTAAPATGTTAPEKTAGTKPQGHAPLGGDGNITAINGTTVTMQEEADEGGAIYSVDASSAKVTNNGAAADLSALKVGDKIFVQGTTAGTNVVATSISVGRGGCKGSRANDSATEAK